jgi:hypothetical protein
MRIKKKIKIRSFPSPNCSGFGYSMGEQIELLTVFACKNHANTVSYSLMSYMASIDVKYGINKELPIPIKNCVIVG